MPAYTGVGHVALTVTDLEISTRFYSEVGAAASGLRRRPLAHHLNFRDPDGIALELTASTEVYAAAMQALRDNDMSDVEIRDYAARLMRPEIVVGR